MTCPWSTRGRGGGRPKSGYAVMSSTSGGSRPLRRRHSCESALRRRPRRIVPHSAGRKLHLCGRLCSLKRSPWVLLMSQATCSPDPARPKPVSQFPFQHSSCTPPSPPPPLAAHVGKHQENIRSQFWLLDGTWNLRRRPSLQNHLSTLPTA